MIREVRSRIRPRCAPLPGPVDGGVVQWMEAPSSLGAGGGPSAVEEGCRPRWKSGGGPRRMVRPARRMAGPGADVRRDGAYGTYARRMGRPAWRTSRSGVGGWGVRRGGVLGPASGVDRMGGVGRPARRVGASGVEDGGVRRWRGRRSVRRLRVVQPHGPCVRADCGRHGGVWRMAGTAGWRTGPPPTARRLSVVRAGSGRPPDGGPLAVSERSAGPRGVMAGPAWKAGRRRRQRSLRRRAARGV